MGWPLLGLCHVIDKKRLISVNCYGMFFSDKGPSSSALWRHLDGQMCDRAASARTPDKLENK